MLKGIMWVGVPWSEKWFSGTGMRRREGGRNRQHAIRRGTDGEIQTWLLRIIIVHGVAEEMEKMEKIESVKPGSRLQDSGSDGCKPVIAVSMTAILSSEAVGHLPLYFL